MKKPKTPPYTLKAVTDYQERTKAKGFVSYSRLVKPEWKPMLDEVLNKLRETLK